MLNPLLISTQVWKDIDLYFIIGLPKSGGFTVIFVVVETLTKFGHLFPLRTDYGSKLVAEVFIKNIVKLHGMPKSIVSDKDMVFTSKFWQHLFKLQGTILAMISVYQSDSQTEALNKFLEMYLSCLTFHSPKIWSKVLYLTEY